MCRPECASCNNARGGSVNRWPLYQCSCHWLEVKAVGPTQRALCILESTGGLVSEHLLFQWDATRGPNSDGKSWQFELDATIVLGKMPPDGANLGWYRASSVGHMLIPIPDRFMLPFNWFESARIGQKPNPLVATNPYNSSHQMRLTCSDDTAVLFRDGVPIRSYLLQNSFRNLEDWGLRLWI